MREKIIVMGGSFNPPTIAHLRLMQAALDQLSEVTPDECVKGVFVPSSEAYVRRKMNRLPTGTDQTVLSEATRLDMLRSFQKQDDRLFADGRELGTTAVKGHTIDTLNAIQQENSEAEIFFIFGGDKLQGLSRWGSYEALASHYKIIVFGRNGIDVKRIIQQDPALARHADAFVILNVPDGLEGISSSAVRERLSRGECVDDLITPEVSAILTARNGND